ncbi:hypothetical protein K0M31_006621 [Melipona bicolor]|uniref:Uncharacterized protein n=1 Tax=Melipona bicolor TaxID=60889 RepID=A0AA40KKX3_9HYME|nr:hypothetical protein K0M31_006621 [Melipona bicolor]
MTISTADKMGNTRSQPYQQRKSPYLFYLIHRTWSIVTDHRKEHGRSDDIDGETDLSSRCSGCNRCDFGQDSLTFDR